MKKIFTFNSYKNKDELAKHLAERISAKLASAIKKRKIASLVVSGGTTPIPFFHALSMSPIDWTSIILTLVDERWVDVTDPASNELLVRDNLLQNYAAKARLIGLKTTSPDPFLGEIECESKINGISRPFDTVVLGMGNDGHTASLFPNDARLADGLDPNSKRSCIGVSPENSPYERISMTLPAILDCRHLFLHITGRKKKEVFNKALEDGPVQDMPIRAFLRQNKVELSIFWAP